MKALRITLIIIVLSIACQSAEKQRIIIPEFNDNFYSTALADLDEELESDAENDKLNRQKLYYCDKLDWPASCLSALDYEKSKRGMTRQLAESYVRYYVKHDEFGLLGDFIDRWGGQFDLYERNQKSYIRGLVLRQQYRRVHVHLRDFLTHSVDTSSLAFASRHYLMMGDTILAMYTLSKLHSISPDHVLMYRFGNILFDLKERERALEVLNKYLEHAVLAPEHVLIIADSYSKNGFPKQAIGLLKPHWQRDTLAFFISSLYERTYDFDSSIMYLDSMIINDPTNLKAIWKKGRAFEDRGWFSYATRLFEEILELDTSYVEARQRIDLIQRKIAYLQRQRQEVIIPPTVELKPIKIEN